MINIKTYLLKDKYLSNDILSLYIDNFWSDIFESNKDNHLFLLCKIQFSDTDDSYRTLGHLVKINYEDKTLFLEYLSERLTILNDSYVTHPISQMSFSYVIKNGKCLDENRTLLLQEFKDKETSNHNFNNLVLPITMDPYKFGEVILSNNIENDSIIRYIVISGDKTYQIDVCENSMVNKVTILGRIKLSWIDSKLNLNDTETFKREIGKSTIYFLDGEVILRKKELPANPFKKLQKESKLSNKFHL